MDQCPSMLLLPKLKGVILEELLMLRSLRIPVITPQRKEGASLDGYAKGLISSSVKGIYLAKIRHLNTAKEMRDILPKLSVMDPIIQIEQRKQALRCKKEKETLHKNVSFSTHVFPNRLEYESGGTSV